MTGDTSQVAICDYEGSRYRAEFWEGKGREFEDRAERIALRSLLPSTGRRLVEIGAGFGRLADLYLPSFEQVILLDYSRSLLLEAREHLGGDPRVTFVAANVYQMPLCAGAVDTAVMVRVAHHLVDIPLAMQEIGRVLCAGGTLVMEYANKRHLKAIFRYLMGRQRWSPFAREPYEFVELNFDFHPAWMEERLRAAGFRIERQRAVSHLRVGWLKRLVPGTALARVDGWLQRPGAVLKLAPSVFVQARRLGQPPDGLPDAFFRCPVCGAEPLSPNPEGVPCPSCGRVWPLRDGIYDFKTPGENDPGNGGD
ncbi:MAG: class I SAM-dependent methyltransferase [Chloroflexi bacterium]|nr:class I SAM-dependent methyltransferase [Chloroflexota bacterium]